MLRFERRRPAVFFGQTAGPAAVRQRQELGRMPLPRRFDLSRILQPIARELSHGLEKRIAELAVVAPVDD